MDLCRAAEAVWSTPRSRLAVMSLRARFVERMTCHAGGNAQKRSEAEGNADQADAEENGFFAMIGVGSGEFLVVIDVEVYRLEIFFVLRNDLLLLHFPKLVDPVLL